MRVGAVLALGVLAAVADSATQAMACTIAFPPDFDIPPGLTPDERVAFQENAETDWRRRELGFEQYGLWNKADTVFLARIEALQPNTVSVRNGSAMDTIEVRDVVLRPVEWLKGEGEAIAFTIGPKRLSSCGLVPSSPAMGGAPGDLHVVYVAGGLPAQETVLAVIPVADIVESEVKSRLPPPQ